MPDTGVRSLFGSPASLVPNSTGFDLLAKSSCPGAMPPTSATTSSRALQQYQQSPFAIQQLLGLSSRASSPKEKLQATSPASSPHSSDASNDAFDSKLSHQSESRASSSISVGSHGTISPVSSPHLSSPPLTGHSTLSVSNLVNSSHVGGPFPPVSAYFPVGSRHSPLSQPMILSHPGSIATSNASCFGDPSPSVNSSRMSYFNSPAAAAFMSAASAHVAGLQQANAASSMSKSHSFGGSGAVNGAISIFNPFGTDVGKFVQDKTGNTAAGKWHRFRCQTDTIPVGAS